MDGFVCLSRNVMAEKIIKGLCIYFDSHKREDYRTIKLLSNLHNSFSEQPQNLKLISWKNENGI